MNRCNEIINYRWTTLDATAAVLAHLIDIWATPYRIRPRDLEGGKSLRLNLPFLGDDSANQTSSRTTSGAQWDWGPIGGYAGHKVGDLISFSLGSTIDPPSVARFFRAGYEWVDVPKEIDVSDKKIQDVLEACFEHDPQRFAHFDPAVVYSSYALAAAANWPEMMPNSPMRIPGVLMNPYNYPWGDLAMLHFDYWGNTELRAALINDLLPKDAGLGEKIWDGIQEAVKPIGTLILWILSDDPWTGMWSKIWPWMLPATKGEHKLNKVLARTALLGVPIRALPTSPAADGSSSPDGRLVTVVSMPPPRIELDGFGRQTITPLRNPVGTLPGPFARRLRASKLRFRITIPVPALTTRIEIYRGDSLYYRETHQLGEFLLPGVHVWSWDGYDKDEIYDSMALKSGNLSARLTVTDLKGRTSVATMPIATAPNKHRWIDTHIDTNSKQIDVTVFNNFLSPSDMKLFDVRLPVDNLSNLFGDGIDWLSKQASPSGGGAMMGMLPSLLDAWPADAGTEFDQLLEQLRATFRTEGQGSDPEGSEAADTLAQYKNLIPGMLNTGEIEAGGELGKIMQGSDLDQEQFEAMRAAVMSGIQRHWSRTVRIEGAEWTLTVNCKERAVDATRTYLAGGGGWLGDLREELGKTPDKPQGDRARSFNLCIVEGLPVFNYWSEGGMMDPSHVDRGWVTDQYADFAETGAHELGHYVLTERKDFWFSLTHKGTSTWDQKNRDDAPFHLEEDENGNVNWEIDIMFYRNPASSRPADTWQERTKGAEEDGCVLISMGKVSFG